MIDIRAARHDPEAFRAALARKGAAETFDEPDALRGRFAVRPSSHPDSVRGRCFQLLGRDGTSAGRITIADGRTPAPKRVSAARAIASAEPLSPASMSTHDRSPTPGSP